MRITIDTLFGRIASSGSIDLGRSVSSDDKEPGRQSTVRHRDARQLRARQQPSSRQARRRMEYLPSARAIASSPPRPNTNGSPPLRRTTRFPRSPRESSADESSPAARCPGARACLRRNTGPASSAGARSHPRARRTSTRSASSSRRSARTVQSSGSPGPAPTSETNPRREAADRVRRSDPPSVHAFPLPLPPSPFCVQLVQRLQQLGTPAVPSGRSALSTLAGWRQRPTAICRDRLAATRPWPRAAGPISAGARPSVEIAIVTPSRLTTPPRYAVACAGSSTALTKMRRASAAARTRLLTSGGAAATTHQAPSRSASSKGLRTTVTPRGRFPQRPPGLPR